MTELEPVEKIPDSALENGANFEFVGEGRLVATWTDDDGVVYSEEYERTGPTKKTVEEDDA